MTTAQMVEVTTHLELDFSSSNYLDRYRAWVAMNHWDVHADHSHRERLPTRKDSILAMWLVGVKPWWMKPEWYVVSTLLMFSLYYRLEAQRRCGRQVYTYAKRCLYI